jgi:hypothetical protein
MTNFRDLKAGDVFSAIPREFYNSDGYTDYSTDPPKRIKYPESMLGVVSDHANGMYLVATLIGKKKPLAQSFWTGDCRPIRLITGKRKSTLLELLSKKEWGEFLETGTTPFPGVRVGGIIGSDPEIFAVDTTGDVIPAFCFLGPKKNASTEDDRTAPYWDGFQAEFSHHPMTCIAYTVDNIQDKLVQLYRLLMRFDNTARLSADSVLPVRIDPSLDEKFVQLGCAPSQNVYGFSTPAVNGRDLPFRFAGGHIHLSVEKSQKTDELVTKVVKILDATIAVMAVSMFRNLDVPVRRKFYGMAGEYRTPEHGIEYRTLSNAWLCHPVATHVIFDLTRIFANYATSTIGDSLLGYLDTKSAVEIVNNCDVDGAVKYINKYQDIFLRAAAIPYGYLPDKYIPVEGASKQPMIEMIKAMILNGIEAVVEDPRKIISNWALDARTWVRHSEAPFACVKTVFTNFWSKGKKV